MRTCAGRGDLMQDPTQEQTAKYLCHGCPTMYACREWAVRVDVDGVAGGLTPAEREEWRKVTGTVLPPPRGFVDVTVLAADGRRHHGHSLELIEGIAALSCSRTAGEVAELVGLSTRSVERILQAGLVTA